MRLLPTAGVECRPIMADKPGKTNKLKARLPGGLAGERTYNAKVLSGGPREPSGAAPTLEDEESYSDEEIDEVLRMMEREARAERRPDRRRGPSWE